jgi:FkbM family methyltransferase
MSVSQSHLLRHANGAYLRPLPWTRWDVHMVNAVETGNEHSLAEGLGIRRVVDVGANIGAFCRLLRRFYPRAEVAAVEPATSCLACLAANAPEARIFHAAISYGGPVRQYFARGHEADTGTHAYLPDPDQVARLPILAGQTEAEERPELRTMTLGEVLAECGWQRADLLKLDCEGAEVGILREADLAPFRRIFVEAHGDEATEAVADLGRRGWAVEPVGDGEFHLLKPPF